MELRTEYNTNDEVRCDFLVSNDRKKIWKVELDLLSKLIEVCEKHDIKLMVFAGTLLGAIRHKGFIPWDDDMDVCLLQEDFDKLKKIAENEFTQPYFFQTVETDSKYFCGYGRLRNSNTTGIIKWNMSENYNNGIFIDIFVLNGIPQNELMLRLLESRISIAQKFCSAYIRETSDENNTVKRILSGILKKTIYRFVPYSLFLNHYYNVRSSYDHKTNKVGLLTHNHSFVKKYWCYKEDFEDIIFVPFENIEVPVSKNYDEILRNTYGDYMSFPPVKDRGAWHEDMIIFNPDIPYKEYFKRQI